MQTCTHTHTHLQACRHAPTHLQACTHARTHLQAHAHMPAHTWCTVTAPRLPRHQAVGRADRSVQMSPSSKLPRMHSTSRLPQTNTRTAHIFATAGSAAQHRPPASSYSSDLFFSSSCKWSQQPWSAQVSWRSDQNWEFTGACVCLHYTRQLNSCVYAEPLGRSGGLAEVAVVVAGLAPPPAAPSLRLQACTHKRIHPCKLVSTRKFVNAQQLRRHSECHPHKVSTSMPQSSSALMMKR